MIVPAADPSRFQHTIYIDNYSFGAARRSANDGLRGWARCKLIDILYQSDELEDVQKLR